MTAAETLWPENPKIFAILTFTEKYLLSLIYVKFQVRSVFKILKTFLNLFSPHRQQNAMTVFISVSAMRKPKEN